MKTKSIVLIPTLCICVVSCQKTSPNNIVTNERIIPTVASTAINAKGSIVTTDNLNVEENEFLMNAWLGTDSSRDDYHFISNETVICRGYMDWATQNVYCWTNGVPTSFWCTFPMSVSGLNITWPGNDPHQLSFTYTIPTSAEGQGAEQQPDICFAFSHKTWTSGAGKAVDIDFKHALAAVIFDISGVAEGISVKAIGFSGLKGSGSCVATGSTSGNGSNKDVSFVWTPSGEDRSWTQSFSSTDFDENKVTKISEDKIFMLIPQILTSTAKLSVKFADGKSEDLTKEVVIGNNSTELKAGKIYTYKINLANGVLSVESLEEYNGSPLV